MDRELSLELDAYKTRILQSLNKVTEAQDELELAMAGFTLTVQAAGWRTIAEMMLARKQAARRAK